MRSVLRASRIVTLAPPDAQPPDLVVPEPPKKTLGWAIVGLGTLSLGQILPAFGKCKFSRPVALVSGHPEKAHQVAEVYGVKKESVRPVGLAFSAGHGHFRPIRSSVVVAAMPAKVTPGAGGVNFGAASFGSRR